MHPRCVTEHVEQSLYHGIRGSLAIGAVNSARLSDGDLDCGGMLLGEVQDCIFDTALYVCVNLAKVQDGEDRRNAHA